MKRIFSLWREHLAKVQGAPFIVCLVLAASCLALVSCSDDNDDSGAFTIADFGGDASFTGTWDGEYNGEVYEIDVANRTFYSNGAYAGNSMIVVADTENSGRFIFCYTRAFVPSAKNAPFYSTDNSIAPDVGKWYAVYFRVIDQNTIALSGGYKSSGPNSFDTASECQASMTKDNGYFAMSSECRRR